MRQQSRKETNLIYIALGMVLLVGLSASCASHMSDPAPVHVVAVDGIRCDTLNVAASLTYVWAHWQYLDDLADPTTGYPYSWNDTSGQLLTYPAHVWTSGFWAGCLWQAYDYTHDSMWLDRAQRWTYTLADQAHNSETHDLGFMLHLSAGSAYALTHDSLAYTIWQQAAHSLAQRYSSQVGMLQSWPANERWEYPVIIDNLMNLELLFAAARAGGDSIWHTIAHRHAVQTIATHQRPDGSHFHVVDFNPVTGDIQWRGRQQGVSDQSAWARGQAWAIYGYAMSFEETNDPTLLAAAIRSANFFCDHLPSDYIPYWDFTLTALKGEPRDASAAAIAAAGLLRLLAVTPDAPDASMWEKTAYRMLCALSHTPMLRATAEKPFLLGHSVGNRRFNRDLDIPLIYADYYYVEALIRYQKLHKA